MELFCQLHLNKIVIIIFLKRRILDRQTVYVAYVYGLLNICYQTLSLTTNGKKKDDVCSEITLELIRGELKESLANKRLWKTYKLEQVQLEQSCRHLHLLA